jgi:tetratricopeptide (TPR) repeat protein
MDILYTVDEKYLQAIEELYYGELPKALHLFNEIINSDADYARAHYQLGSIYHYHFKNYQSAGYHYKQAVALDPAFPDVYDHYLKLVVTLKMHKLVQHIADQALVVPGVCKADIYEKLGLYAEEQQDFTEALKQYKKAEQATLSESELNLYQAHVKRVDGKQKSNQQMIYAYQG